MKSFKLKASVVAMMVALPGLASATVTLTNQSPTNIDGVTVPATAPAGTPMYSLAAVTSAGNDITDTTGTGTLDVFQMVDFGVSNTQTRYFRYDLTNAKPLGAFTPDDLVVDDNSTLTAAPDATIAIASQGATYTGSEQTGYYVIFQITAKVDLPQDKIQANLAIGTGTPGGIDVINTGSPVCVNFQLHEKASESVNQGSQTRLKWQQGCIAQFDDVAADVLTPQKSIVDVNDQYTDFAFQNATVKSSSAPGTPARAPSQFTTIIGHWGVPTAQNLLNANSVPYAPSGEPEIRLYADTFTTGTFGADDWANNGYFWFSGNQYCEVAPDNTAGHVNLIAGMMDMDVTSVAGVLMDSYDGNGDPLVDYVSFDLTGTGATAGTLCYTASGEDAIPSTNFEVSVENALGTGFSAPAPIGQFVRNGSVLRAAYVMGGAQLNLANMSASAVGYTTMCYSSKGAAAVAGTEGSVAANASLRLKWGSVCPAGNDAAEFTFDGPEGSVVGSVLRFNPATGDYATDAMTGNQNKATFEAYPFWGQKLWHAPHNPL